MIIHSIGRLRRLSRETRDRIALGIASSFTLVVAVLWGFNSVALPMEQQTANSEAVFSTFVSGMGEQFDDFKDGWRSNFVATNTPATTTSDEGEATIEALVRSLMATTTPTETGTGASSTPVREVQIEAVPSVAGTSSTSTAAE